jgi:hypothetical protein
LQRLSVDLTESTSERHNENCLRPNRYSEIDARRVSTVSGCHETILKESRSDDYDDAFCARGKG